MAAEDSKRRWNEIRTDGNYKEFCLHYTEQWHIYTVYRLVHNELNFNPVVLE